jgi:hypothetical protein
MPLVLGLVAFGLLLAASGLKGKTFAEILRGDYGDALDAAGANIQDLLSQLDALSQPNALGGTGATDTDNPIAGGLADIAKGGTAKFDGLDVAAWMVPILKCARQNGWKGRVTSGYRDPARQRQACINVCGNPNGCPGTCAPPGESNHQTTAYPGGAVDVSDRDGFERAMSRCGGKLRNALPKDRVHFSVSGH